MKIIIIGLGNFGGRLGNKLMAGDYEVIGVDVDMSRVNKYNNIFTATMCVDSSDESAILQIPFKDADMIIVAIGENVGQSITTTALLKKHFKGRIIARSINEIHKGILEAMDITEIVEPEAEFANEFYNRIGIPNAIKSMDLPGEYEIVEVVAPKKLIGKNIKNLDAKKNHNIYIITIICRETRRNILNVPCVDLRVMGILPPDYNIAEGDFLLIFGQEKAIHKFVTLFS